LDLDDDGDGILTIDEYNYVQNGLAGDLDGDGIVDIFQNHIASLKRGVASGVNDFVTLKAQSGCSIVEVANLSSSDFPADTTYTHPYGLMNFEVYGCTGMDVTLYYYETPTFPSGTVYRKYGAMP